MTRRSRPRIVLAALGIAILTLLGIRATFAQTAAPSPATVSPRTDAARVATGLAPPFVLREGNGPFAGFSIELWAALAHRLGVTTDYLDLGPRSDAAQLQAVQDGRADVAIAAITITPDRERSVDFSMPYFDSGLQILVPPDAGGIALLDTLGSLLAPSNLIVLGLSALFVLLLAHVLWLVERRADPAFRRGYLRSIGNGIWGVILIIATGEHGDRDTPRIVKRLTVAGMWLIGVVLVAQFTATLTSSLTVQQLQTAIRGPDDLPGRRVATVAGSIAAAYLRDRGIEFTPITSVDQAASLLARRQVDAIVYEAPSLQYWVRLRSGAGQIVGPVFNPERYGIAVPLGSALRKRINTALLEMQADGSFEAMRGRWFGQPR